MKLKMFTDAGLTHNEAAAYKALLEEGKLTPPAIAERLSITRQNSYAILKSLEKLGLATVDRRHNKMRYVPGDPMILEGIIKNKKKKLETTEDQLSCIMPELASFYNLAKDRPGISTFKGIDGIQALYQDTIRRKPKEILLILSESGKSNYMSTWIVRNYRPQRIKNNIALREIINTPDKNDPEELKKLLWAKKYISIPSMPKDVDMLLYDDNVTFIKYSKKSPIGFTIDDQIVYSTIKSLFETLWQNA